MKKVVITGATGMIGISLIKEFVKSNVHVLAIVRPNSANIKYIKNPIVKIIESDLSNLQEINISEEYDTFYHLGWIVTSLLEIEHVELQVKNITYSIEAIKLAKRLKCHTVIGVGSQAEYGIVSKKISSNTRVDPKTPYGIAKFCSGKITQVLASQLGINHIWTRILSVYGPYDKQDTLVMSSIREMLENHQSPEYTKAEQLWDYLYVKDASRALYLIGEKGKKDSVYCIGSGKSKPLYEYIIEIRNQIDKNILLKLGKKEVSNNKIVNLCADISNLTKDTGFIPEFSFKEGIAQTIKWFKENNKNKKDEVNNENN